MSNYNNILAEITKTAKTWKDIKTELSKFNVHDSSLGLKDTRAGKIFELFTKYYFKTSPSEKDNYKNVWLFEEIPTEVRHNLNIGKIDFGVDLVLEDIEGLFYVVQCKFRNDENSVLNWTADKIANLFGFCPNADGYIVFSNATDLDSVSKTRHDKFTFYSITSLLEIDSDLIEAIYSSLTNSKVAERKLFAPKPHQEDAISSCVEFFEIESRGQLILPCGAGKTLTALWIKERLECSTTLVLVPSLSLLRQIKNEWAKQRSTLYKYICVCSETDIDDDNIDTLVSYTYEVDVHVTTNSAIIRDFLQKEYTEKVIFSTYHSLASVEDAITGTGFEFDLIFCDEAHKTAGVGQNKFSLVHDNDKIPSKRRLYATATPRIVKESLKKKLGDDLKFAYDMNDPEIFGYEFYRMTFKDAIEAKILVDYQIIAIGVNNEDLKTYIENRNYTDNLATIDAVANNYALEHVMAKYNANHAITFHSRVKLAKEFVDRHKKIFHSVDSFTVNGEQTTSSRNIILDEFKHSRKAIISNARCLTEGVDVPAIDLVYFSDPKNSKVDIVQAVGRALRKKEGKEKGFIVIPIYHTRNDNVEKVISKSSFSNLLQVIRSLCEQDERLQDEINSLAYGKGKKKPSQIDFTNATFSGEQDIILLQGFDEKLKNSLFDEVIEKTSNNWDIWFLKFKEFVGTNGREPLEEDNISLYRWVSQQRNRKKNGLLKNEEIRKLNEVNFIWDRQEWKWESMYSELVEYAKVNEFEPHKESNSELASWYGTQRNQLKSGTLRDDRVQRINAIKFKGSANRNKWLSQYEELVQFRVENPDKWPQQDRGNKLNSINKLASFCQIIRKLYRESNLDDYRFDKMVEIGFNFEGKVDNWTTYHGEVKNIIANCTSITIAEIGENAYSWIMRHKRQLEDGKLSKYQSDKILELNLDNYFETWDERFIKVEKWVIENKKIPTSNSNKEFSSWLYSQRYRYKNGTLSDEQITKLVNLGYDLEAKGKERNEQKWLDNFNLFKEFLSKNNREPSSVSEKELYIWVQTQRASMAGTLKNRKPLSQERIDLLGSINFQWIGDGRANKSWEDHFREFVCYVEPNGKLLLPSVINGDRHPLYTWWRTQKMAFERGELLGERIQAFKDVGIDFNESEVNTGRDGFTKWAKKTIEIANFIKTNGYYPRAGKDDKLESNLYQSLTRTKRLYRDGELSEKQVVLLKELDIVVE